MSVFKDIKQQLSAQDIEHFFISSKLSQGQFETDKINSFHQIWIFSCEKRLKAAKSKFLNEEIYYYPQMDFWRDHRNIVATLEMQNRMSTLVALCRDKPVIVATTATALLQSTISVELLSSLKTTLYLNEDWHKDSLIDLLCMMGYVQSDSVEYYGTYRSCGDVFDLFCPGYNDPIRLHIKNNEICSISLFSKLDQSTKTQTLDLVEIYPAIDVVLPQGKIQSCAQKLHEYFLSTNQDPKLCEQMISCLYKRQSFVGLYKFAPLFRKASKQDCHSLIDHLQFHHDRLNNSNNHKHCFKCSFWLLEDQAEINDSIARSKVELEDAYKWEIDNSVPTLANKWHFDWSIKLHQANDFYDLNLVNLKKNFFNKKTTKSQSLQHPHPQSHNLTANSKFKPNQVNALLAKNIPQTNSLDSYVLLDDYVSSTLANFIKSLGSTDDVIDQVWQKIIAFDQNQKKTLMSMTHSRSSNDLDSYKNFNKLVMVCENNLSQSRVIDLLNEKSMDYELTADCFNLKTIQLSQKLVLVSIYSELKKDYFLNDYGIHYIPDNFLIKGKKQLVRKSRSKKSQDDKWKNYLNELSQLQIGDLVVHRDHGIGLYRGLFSLKVLDKDQECIKIEYKGGDKIYLPSYKINLLQKHSTGANYQKSFEASDEQDSNSNLNQNLNLNKHVYLDSLSKSSSWQKKRSKAKKALKDLAEAIIKNQSKRAIAKKDPFKKPCEIYQKFIEDFQFTETKDQLAFCEDIESDFASDKAMDRLLIGDVGFGKTEMAMRAAMRVVLEGYQVLVLCPTTVLCFQHHQTFLKRMSKFSVQIEAVNRFIPLKDQSVIAKRLKEHKIDILIGSHLILNAKFQAKKLALVVIDEEQRFGVSHKEKIKSLRAQAGVLCLSATPIPRTLHMSMLGLRDISLLTTPPPNRLAIKNVIIDWDNDKLRTAILSEIRRGGQVFFVHNRIQDINVIKDQLNDLVPECDIRIAHGRLKVESLERILRDFVMNKFDVLLCTTIMESGVDMPNVNTIIVNNAHSFGLSQLYQLRGRVGRAGLQAYAYLITPAQSCMNDLARKRMHGIMNFQALASGFSISSYDMDIRGVGDLLGNEQSGHVASVGLEMYTSMLDEAIRRARGEMIIEDQDIEISILESYNLSKSYIASEKQRVGFYKKLFTCKCSQSIYKWAHDLEDRYGSMPKEGQNLTMVALIKLCMYSLAAKSLKEFPKARFHLNIPRLPDAMWDNLMRCVQSSEYYQLKDPTNLVIDLTKFKKTQNLTLFYEKLYDLVKI